MLESTSEKHSDFSFLFVQFSSCVLAQAIGNRAWSCRLVPTFAYCSRSSGCRLQLSSPQLADWAAHVEPLILDREPSRLRGFCAGPADGTGRLALQESLSWAALNNTSNSSSHRRTIAASTSDAAGGALLVFISFGSESSRSRARATFSSLTRLALC